MHALKKEPSSALPFPLLILFYLLNIFVDTQLVPMVVMIGVLVLMLGFELLVTVGILYPAQLFTTIAYIAQFFGIVPENDLLTFQYSGALIPTILKGWGIVSLIIIPIDLIVSKYQKKPFTKKQIFLFVIGTILISCVLISLLPSLTGANPETTRGFSEIATLIAILAIPASVYGLMIVFIVSWLKQLLKTYYLKRR